MDRNTSRTANAREFRRLIFDRYRDDITHCEYVLKYLDMYGSITPREALDAFGCMRLGARISDLRERGHDIVTDINEGRKKFAVYSLAGEGESDE